jgi:outer membrane protein assembly factor BamA
MFCKQFKLNAEKEQSFMLERAPIMTLLTVLSLVVSPLNLVAESSDSTSHRQNSLIAMPLINNSPAMKTGFGGIGMYMFTVDHNDNVSPASVAMLYGLYSTNKSYMALLPLSLYLKEDTWRLTGMIGTMRINNDFTYETAAEDLRLVYSELRTFYFIAANRQIAPNFYAGMLYSGSQTRYRFDQGSTQDNEFTKALFKVLGIGDNFVSSLGIALSYDSRDYVYYPSAGWSLTIRPMYYATWLGGNNNYTSISYDAKHYQRLGEKSILAMRFAGGHSVGDVPFDGYQSYGMRGTLRGYQAGKYRGKHMMGIQAEYRWQFYKRLGCVGFAGVGTIWGQSDEDNDLFEKDLLPSLGMGLRFQLSLERKINLRMDYAWGVNDNEGFYLGIMEAF